MKAELTIGTRVMMWLACVVSLGCARDARSAPEPEPVMTPAAGEQSEPTPKASNHSEPSNYIVLEESVRITCNLPNDEEKAPKFDYDKAALRPRGEGILDGVARCLTEGPMKGQSITIVGHADPRGSEDYNQQLGRRRAGNVGQCGGLPAASVFEKYLGETS